RLPMPRRARSRTAVERAGAEGQVRRPRDSHSAQSACARGLIPENHLGKRRGPVAFERLIPFLLLCRIGLAQYVGSEACRACHPSQFTSQSKTGHARALAVAPPGSPGHWAFGAGAKAITYVSQAPPDSYREHGLSYYASTKEMAPTPGHPNAGDM